MPITISPDRILNQSLSDMYRGKTILDYSGKPFKVAYVRVWDDSPDPGWTVTFESSDYPSQRQARSINLGEPLPEIWPYEVPVSPAS